MNTFSKLLSISELQEIKGKITDWANTFDPCIILDSNGNSKDIYSQYDLLVAVDPYATFEIKEATSQVFADFKLFFEGKPDWCFGYLKYDLKNAVYNLESRHLDPIGFAQMMFFKPSILISIEGDKLTIKTKDNRAKSIYTEIVQQEVLVFTGIPIQKIKHSVSKENYLENLQKIKHHIQFGDFYEMNYCQSFYVNNAKKIDPFQLFKKLNSIDKSPFSAYIKDANKHLICASPERFILKKGQTIISQPIKGTIARGKTHKEDEANKNSLQSNPKDISENVMIVDLVRNDLSQIAEKGTVKVKELMGIYSFEKVFQMISTVEAQLAKHTHFSSVLQALFPMGSMTGAPKYAVVKAIDEIEDSNRGLYSGTVGYITPDGDFDFNVVIRSIQYNSESDYLSFHAGGAIVDKSIPIDEYDECHLKVGSIFNLLLGK